MRILVGALAALIVAAPLSAMAADGDVKKGKKVFRKCKACHVVKKEKNRVGPHLVNIVGRKAGAVADFKYSPALMKMAGDGLVWDDENFLKFVTKPKEFMPGTKMAFAGLKKEKQRVDLLAYLKSLAPKAE